jgi:hypothetical protein
VSGKSACVVRVGELKGVKLRELSVSDELTDDGGRDGKADNLERANCPLLFLLVASVATVTEYLSD